MSGQSHCVAAVTIYDLDYPQQIPEHDDVLPPSGSRESLDPAILRKPAPLASSRNHSRPGTRLRTSQHSPSSKCARDASDGLSGRGITFNQGGVEVDSENLKTPLLHNLLHAIDQKSEDDEFKDDRLIESDSKRAGEASEDVFVVENTRRVLTNALQIPAVGGSETRVTTTAVVAAPNCHALEDDVRSLFDIEGPSLDFFSMQRSLTAREAAEADLQRVFNMLDIENRGCYKLICVFNCQFILHNRYIMVSDLKLAAAAASAELSLSMMRDLMGDDEEKTKLTFEEFTRRLMENEENKSDVTTGFEQLCAGGEYVTTETILRACRKGPGLCCCIDHGSAVGPSSEELDNIIFQLSGGEDRLTIAQYARAIKSAKAKCEEEEAKISPKRPETFTVVLP